MGFKIVWTQKASEDIEAIVRHIARKNSKGAHKIGVGIYRRAQILKEHPESGSVLTERDDPSLRKLIYRNWKIVYRVIQTDRVAAVLRVWHAARGEVELDEVP